MALEKLDKVPQEKAELRNGIDGHVIAVLYKNVESTKSENGETEVLAQVRYWHFPKNADEATIEEVLENFDYYFDKADALEAKQEGSVIISHLEKLLSDTDYKLLKHQDGVLSDAEYAPWKKLRQHWRDCVNKLQEAKTLADVEAVKYAETPEGLEDLKKAGVL